MFRPWGWSLTGLVPPQNSSRIAPTPRIILRGIFGGKPLRGENANGPMDVKTEGLGPGNIRLAQVIHQRTVTLL